MIGRLGGLQSWGSLQGMQVEVEVEGCNAGVWGDPDVSVWGLGLFDLGQQGLEGLRMMMFPDNCLQEGFCQ